MASSDFVQALRGHAGTLPPGRRVLAPEVVAQVHRARLEAAIVEVAGEKGYAATTVADIVSRAQVSRRTFYEHFTDKDACFLSAYEASADVLMAIVTQAVDVTELKGFERIESGVFAYLNTLASEPALTRLFLVDILSAGPEALARRRSVHQRLADLVLTLVNAHQDELPPDWAIDRAMATAFIGAVNELVLLTLDEGNAEQLPRIADTAIRLVGSMLAPPTQLSARRRPAAKTATRTTVSVEVGSVGLLSQAGAGSSG